MRSKAVVTKPKIRPTLRHHRLRLVQHHSDLDGYAPRQLLGKRKTTAPKQMAGHRNPRRKDNYSCPGPIESAPYGLHVRVFKRTGYARGYKYAQLEYPALTPYEAKRRWAENIPSTDSTPIRLPLEKHLERMRQDKKARWALKEPYPRKGRPEEDYAPNRPSLDSYISRAAENLKDRPPPPRPLMQYGTDMSESEDMDVRAARQGIRERWLSESRHFFPGGVSYNGRSDKDDEPIHPWPQEPPRGGFNLRKFFCCLQINCD